ncbi:MAG TPA: UDP-glucose 4-epimerase GalE [Tahibacter sp.]|uniref:UDP-glucose 4-epimerase GalE n=1 Tax=Tahibacter sp. TaxID=2056211 RepID=UPI002C3345B5|nr:UDP-glucose 4-epimerase GalE [Tahibacter sp.]HSX61021.1 UDP-glucose 4-epimerase GalE [Tahibacter sp.]
MASERDAQPPRGAVLVTGGAGYIGSHVVARLVDAGEDVVTLDDLSTGFRDAVVGGTFVEGDVGDRALVASLLREHRVRAVMHFAARIIVAESMADPIGYYANNTAATCQLLAACTEAGIAHFVLSSSAAVYGVPEGGRATEASPLQPISPYGRSKLMSEQMLRDLAAVSALRYVALRYFNVAGCDGAGRIGQSTRRPTLLMKVAAEAALGVRPHVAICGTDYPTPDGTGIRDYVHVDDLAAAHVCALGYLRDGGASVALNVGYGRGYSVREVLSAVERAHGRPLPVVEAPRRAGDPPELVADCAQVRSVLGWEPRHDDLDLMARSTLAWERRLAERRNNAPCREPPVPAPP